VRNSAARGWRLSDSPARRTDLERALLRQLCYVRLTRAAWAKISRALREYSWWDVEHGLVYAAIQRLGPCEPKVLHEQLPAQATRMGFPDIDWQAYFSLKGSRPSAFDSAQISRLIRALQRCVDTRISPRAKQK